MSVSREKQEYRDGLAAHAQREALDDCPCRIGDSRRTAWMTGWLDANTNARLGHVFRKYGMSHL